LNRDRDLLTVNLAALKYTYDVLKCLIWLKNSSDQMYTWWFIAVI